MSKPLCSYYCFKANRICYIGFELIFEHLYHSGIEKKPRAENPKARPHFVNKACFAFRRAVVSSLGVIVVLLLSGLGYHHY